MLLELPDFDFVTFLTTGSEEMAGEEGSVGSSGGFDKKPKIREWRLRGPGPSTKKGRNLSGILVNRLRPLSKTLFCCRLLGKMPM